MEHNYFFSIFKYIFVLYFIEVALVYSSMYDLEAESHASLEVYYQRLPIHQKILKFKYLTHSQKKQKTNR